MQATSLRCQHCGGEITIASRFAATVVCRYCNTVYLLENDSLSKTGVTKPFRPLSFLHLGFLGKYSKQNLEVIGRIRLEDDEDQWDEWYVLIDKQPAWIEESGDTLTLFSSQKITQALPAYEEVRVGQVLQINGHDIFIAEKGSAKVIGIEGEFPGRVKPNQNYVFLQGHTQDKVYAIEYHENSISLLEGEAIEFSAITSHEN